MLQAVAETMNLQYNLGRGLLWWGNINE